MSPQNYRILPQPLTLSKIEIRSNGIDQQCVAVFRESLA